MIIVELEELLKTLKTLQQKMQYDQFFELMERALEIAKEIDSSRYLIELNLEKGMAYFHLGNLEFALSTLMDFRNLIQANTNRAYSMRLYNGLAVIHGSLNEFEEFYLYLNKTKDLAEELKDKEVLATVHNSFVIYYDRKKQYELALKHVNYCMDYLMEDEFYKERDVYLNLQVNLAGLYIKLKNLDAADATLNALFDLIEGKEFTRLYSELYTTRAKWFTAMKYYEEAYTTLQKVKHLATKIQDHNLLQEVNRNIVEVVNLLKDKSKIIQANDDYIDSIQFAQQQNYKVKLQQVELLLDKRKFKDQIYLDPLTNIHNRRYFEKVTNEWLEDENSEQLFMYFIFDADHFKQVNDIHGHLVGDEVIKKLAKTGQEMLTNQTAVFSRFGGDEFVGLAKLQSYEEMEQIIAPLQRALSQIQFEVDETFYSVTASIGAAAMKRKQFMTIEELMKQADDALYNSKRNGRNRYTLFSEFHQNQENGTLHS